MKQHPTAVIAPDTKIAGDVEIGPFSYIYPGAEIGPGNILESHVVIHGCVKIGSGNRFHQAAAIGDWPQDSKYGGSHTIVEIGDGNVFREFCTVHRGTETGSGQTIIGNDNYFMVYSHVAHDCVVGNGTVFGNSGSLAGHVAIEDFATVGPFSGVTQFCRVGAHGWIGAHSLITKDVLPYSKTVGNRPKVYGPNLIGLQRRGFSMEAIKNIGKAYRILFRKKLNTSQALDLIEQEITGSPEVDYLVQFIRSSKHGIVK